MTQDLKHGIRLLLRSPGFTTIAIAALAIGIGANTAIFSVVNTLLLRPLPYERADELAVLWEHNIPRDRKNNVISPGNFIHWREMQQTFVDLAAVGLTFTVTLTGAGEPEELPMQLRDRLVLLIARRETDDRPAIHRRGGSPSEPRGRHQRPLVETTIRR